MNTIKLIEQAGRIFYILPAGTMIDLTKKICYGYSPNFGIGDNAYQINDILYKGFGLVDYVRNLRVSEMRPYNMRRIKPHNVSIYISGNPFSLKIDFQKKEVITERMCGSKKITFSFGGDSIINAFPETIELLEGVVHCQKVVEEMQKVKSVTYTYPYVWHDETRWAKATTNNLSIKKLKEMTNFDFFDNMVQDADQRCAYISISAIKHIEKKDPLSL